MPSYHHYAIAIVTLALLCSCHSGEGKETPNPIELTEDSWHQLLKGEWMVDFYAPWCPACKALQPHWQKFADWSEDLNIKVASADVTANPGLSGRFMISGLPTIYHVKDGIFRPYNGPRDHKAFINFIEGQGWKAVEPLSRLWAPNSFQMSFISHAFRISMTLRDVHNYLVDEVGFPYYLSYLLFAITTVTLGTIIGLFIVFVIDLICPVGANPQAPPSSKVKSKKKDDDSDVEVDDGANSQTKPTANPERPRRRVKS